MLPEWQGMKTVVLVLLCLAMICFPFSVAATNISLGLMLAAGLLSGMWWQGARALWQYHRALSVALVVYLVLVLIGMLWSIDSVWGIKILARHWFWLLLPIVVMVLSTQQNRNIFLAVMSFGLTANLVFCVLQANGLIDSHAAAGSSATNATGHIGHTSFGFIYGIWSAWLLHWGLIHRGGQAWLAWALALWAVVMVFMAQGQSGYIVTVGLLLLVVAKWVHAFRVRHLVVAGLALLLIVAAVMMLGTGKQRIIGTWQALVGSDQKVIRFSPQAGALSSTQARLAWWSMSIDIWKQSAFYGVGTGGFPQAVKLWQADPALQHGYINEYSQFKIVHPHNQYLITLVRYGLVGLVILLILIGVWIGSGVKRPWNNESTSPLIALTGVALMLHGLDSTSFEEHFSTIFALIMLGAGLSERYHGGERGIIVKGY